MSTERDQILAGLRSAVASGGDPSAVVFLGLEREERAQRADPAAVALWVNECEAVMRDLRRLLSTQIYAPMWPVLPWLPPDSLLVRRLAYGGRKARSARRRLLRRGWVPGPLTEHCGWSDDGD